MRVIALPPRSGDYAVKNDRYDCRIAGLRRKTKFRNLLRIHNGLGGAEQNFNHHLSRNILADNSGTATVGKKFSEVTLDQFPTSSLHQLEHLRCLSSNVAHKGRFDLFGVPLHAGEQSTKGSEGVRG